MLCCVWMTRHVPKWFVSERETGGKGGRETAGSWARSIVEGLSKSRDMRSSLLQCLSGAGAVSCFLPRTAKASPCLSASHGGRASLQDAPAMHWFVGKALESALPRVLSLVFHTLAVSKLDRGGVRVLL